MHILLGIAAAVVGVIFFLYRLNMAAKAGQEVVETVKDLRNMKRSHDFRKKAGQDPARHLDDPSVAAAAILHALANSERSMTEKCREILLAEMGRVFGLDDGQASDLLAEGGWYVRDMHNLDAIVDRFIGVIGRHCNPAERSQFLEMMRTVAAADGQPSDIQASAVANAARKLGL